MSRQIDPGYDYRNLETVLFHASPTIWHDGMEWYEVAHDFCRGFKPYTVKQAAAVTAALSRNTSWPLNVIYAERFLNGERIGHLKPVLAQANAVLAGAEPLAVLTGWKIRAFYDNIADPLHSEAVSVDRHAAALLAGMPTPAFVKKYKSVTENKHLHRKAVELYTRAGRERGVKPHQAQAVAWLYHKSYSEGES